MDRAPAGLESYSCGDFLCRADAGTIEGKASRADFATLDIRLQQRYVINKATADSLLSL